MPLQFLLFGKDSWLVRKYFGQEFFSDQKMVKQFLFGNRWCSEIALRHLFPKAFAVATSKNSSIFDNQKQSSWRIAHIRTVSSEVTREDFQLKSLIQMARPQQQATKNPIWRWYSRGKFSVGSITLISSTEVRGWM